MSEQEIRYTVFVLVTGDTPDELEGNAFREARRLTGDIISPLAITPDYKIRGIPVQGSLAAREGVTPAVILALIPSGKRLYADIGVRAYRAKEGGHDDV